MKETHPKFTHFITYLKNKEIPESKIFFQNKLIKPLSGESANICKGKATKEECINYLNEIKNDKSPGSDGLTSEFYKRFWEEIEMMFYKVLIVPSIKANYQYVNSKGLESQLILVMDNTNAPVIASHLNQRGKKRMNLIIL